MSIEVHESGTDLTAVCHRHGTANLMRIHDKKRISQSDRRDRKEWGKADEMAKPWGCSMWSERLTHWNQNQLYQRADWAFGDDGNTLGIDRLAKLLSLILLEGYSFWHLKEIFVNISSSVPSLWKSVCSVQLLKEDEDNCWRAIQVKHSY